MVRVVLPFLDRSPIKIGHSRRVILWFGILLPSLSQPVHSMTFLLGWLPRHHVVVKFLPVYLFLRAKVRGAFTWRHVVSVGWHLTGAVWHLESSSTETTSYTWHTSVSVISVLTLLRSAMSCSAPFGVMNELFHGFHFLSFFLWYFWKMHFFDEFCVVMHFFVVPFFLFFAF